ncbi:hypothetical protein HAZT_HAZT010110 [Hyalella azteca]|uniref:Protein-S-isoprenylcysteine O-methyltransferase n=1 Tax=Hyalella azteca TaxID=294128 RepID=A0A6A0HC13_HYAAZ|nr:protein-S-isoprenylcysteine O-methyltransferase [Hyalella azteca]KAA0202804.1 hypothetical protein HAZT_HAZT010110 [Hyalella azteca]
MSLIRNGQVSLQSFILGSFVSSYLLLSALHLWLTAAPQWFLWILSNSWIYILAYFILSNIIIRLLYWDDEWMVAVCGNLTGVAFGSGLVIVALDLHGLRIFGGYVMVLAFFHFSEYFITAATNPTTLSLDSYLLNHSWAYWLAGSASWAEYFLELWLFPPIKSLWYVAAAGATICILGEITRKLSMITAQKNFNHLVQVRRQSGHKLVTHGVYGWFRHPSYVGWFWWSVGTQILLINPVCAVLYAVTSWLFFKERITFEEMTLISFFGQEYIDYQKRVGTGLPFIKGYLLQD